MVGQTVMSDDYQQLKDNFIRLLITSRSEHDLLKTSLTLFQKQIKSKRSESKIKSVNELVKVLEFRDELSSTNVVVLRLWADAVACPSGRSVIDQYEKLNSLSSTNCVCTTCKKPIPLPELDKLSEKKIPKESTDEKKLPKRQSVDDVRDAFDKIAPQLGYSWRDLARCLDLTEYDIEEIESTHRRLIDMSYAVLKIWRQDHGDDVTVNNLIRALLQCRRKDLHDKLLKL